MLTKSILAADDVAGLIAAVFEYNRKGVVGDVLWYDMEGKVLPLAYCEVLTEQPGLVVRMQPEELSADSRQFPGLTGATNLDGSQGQ